MPRPRALAPVVALLAIAALLALRACIAVDPLDHLAIGTAAPGDPPGTTIYTGSIDVVRGGPVLVGYQGAGSTVLLAGQPANRDCRDIADGKVCRMIVPAGPAALRFAAVPGARLMWMPVGRRGEPEYVQPSLLSPDPPDTATFGDDPDRALADGLIAAAILAILVATLLASAWPRLVRVPRATWIAMAAIFVAAVVVRWLGLSDHGQTWDEDVNWSAGRNYVTNLLSLDFRARSWTWNYEHPPVMKYLEGIGAQLADGYGPARALSALWVAIGCALMVPIGARLYGARVGWFAGGIAALLPPLVAHGQIVGHEAPTVMWWALGVLLALCAFDDLPVKPDDARARRTLAIRLAWIGVAVGVATASRFVNGLLGPACLAIVIVRAPVRWRRAAALRASLIIAPISVLTIYALWPRLWASPFAMLADSYKKLSATHSVEPFLGNATATPGVAYFPLFLLATLPIAVLALAIAGSVRAARTKTSSRLVMVAWLACALGVIASPVRQDGVRYVLPAVMALALLAAIGADSLAAILAPRWRHAPAAVGAALALYLGSVLWRAHPYYLDYFGEQVGGASTVADHRWAETAWWGEGVDRAVDYVNANAEPGAVVARCIEPAHLAWFRDDLWAKMTPKPSAAQWIVWYSPESYPCGIPADAKLVYEVENDGLVLARVYRR